MEQIRLKFFTFYLIFGRRFSELKFDFHPLYTCKDIVLFMNSCTKEELLAEVVKVASVLEIRVLKTGWDESFCL